MKKMVGVVLAGGKAQRMQGEEKGLLVFHGQPMVSCVLNAMRPFCDELVINANTSLSEYQSLDLPVISDVPAYADRGPLSGILSVLEHCQSDYVMISPCDTPNISSVAFQALYDASSTNKNSICCLESESGLHPLHAILPVESAVQSLKAFLDENDGNSVMRFYAHHGFHLVKWSKESELLNVNYLDQLSTAKV